MDFLRHVHQEISLRGFAIGSITLDNLPQVLATSIRRIAISGAIESARNPPATTVQTLQILANAELT